MKRKALVVVALSLGVVCFAGSAGAQEDSQAAAAPAKPKKIFMGLSAGAVYATVSHPEFVASRFSAATLGLHGGYVINDRFSFSLELTTIEKYVTRNGARLPFAPEGTYSPLAGCDKCEPPPPGGWLAKTTALFGAVAPGIEFAPYGKNGVYVGAAAGLGFIYGLENRIGGSGAARFGYRYRVGDTVGLSMEAGVQGQVYADAHVYAPFISLMLRPYM